MSVSTANWVAFATAKLKNGTSFGSAASWAEDSETNITTNARKQLQILFDVFLKESEESTFADGTIIVIHFQNCATLSDERPLVESINITPTETKKGLHLRLTNDDSVQNVTHTWEEDSQTPSNYKDIFLTQFNLLLDQIICDKLASGGSFHFQFV